MSCDMFVMSCAINSQREEVYNLLFFDVCVYLIHNPSSFLLSVIIIIAMYEVIYTTRIILCDTFGID